MGAAGAYIMRGAGWALRDAHERGDANEQRVLRVLMRARRPWWLIEARLTTASQDRKGLDLVVETVDTGTLYLQVKSSERFAEEWRQRYRNTRYPVRVLVAERHLDANSLYGRVLAELILLRERVASELRAEDEHRAGPRS